MGWFWADSQRPAAAPAPKAATSLTPPPGCPMHESASPHPAPPSNESGCPVKKSSNSPFNALSNTSSSEHATTLAGDSSSSSSSSSSSPSPSGASKMNPLNYMFSFISQERAANQTVDLPVEREISSIPRADGADGNWEYPSPQQMYNAMLRKGYTDTPQDAVESMVAVHNFLNEGAWTEIVEWEQIFAKGLKSGWDRCRHGNENLSTELARQRLTSDEEQPSLIRFQGRPRDLSPKARVLQALGWLYPAKYGTEPPFDRHDWYVSRQTPSGEKEVRYVIDYYSAPPEPTGEPVFFLDIRPAVDTPTAAVERLMRWGGDVWWKASGGAVRDTAR